MGVMAAGAAGGAVVSGAGLGESSFVVTRAHGFGRELHAGRWIAVMAAETEFTADAVFTDGLAAVIRLAVIWVDQADDAF